jgi:hypothetical protein
MAIVSLPKKLQNPPTHIQPCIKVLTVPISGSATGIDSTNCRYGVAVLVEQSQLDNEFGAQAGALYFKILKMTILSFKSF